MPPASPPIDELAAILAAHLADKQIGAAVAQALSDADDAISQYQPTCWYLGECCRFGAAEHRLYVTVPELIHFAQNHPPVPVDDGADVCPFQREGRCTAREARPLGCRVYFCQASARWWQSVVTEEYLRRLRDLGERFNLPYLYVEWLDGLRALHSSRRNSSGSP
jgi:Fe-S-cluster containining protein